MLSKGNVNSYASYKVCDYLSFIYCRDGGWSVALPLNVRLTIKNTETGSYDVVQAGFKLVILLPQTLRCAGVTGLYYWAIARFFFSLRHGLTVAQADLELILFPRQALNFDPPASAFWVHVIAGLSHLSLRRLWLWHRLEPEFNIFISINLYKVKWWFSSLHGFRILKQLINGN